MKKIQTQDKALIVPLDLPRFVEGTPLLIAGLRGSYTVDSRYQIPALWQRFSHYIGKLSEQVGQTAYGLCFTETGDSHSFDYIAGIEVDMLSDLPTELIHLSIPAQTYAVFPHHHHVSKIKDTVCAIYSSWLPESGYEVINNETDLPDFFESDGSDFNPQTGMGGIEIWLPIKA